MIHSTIRPVVCCPCACRDCMELTYGGSGAMCHACEDAGCPGDRECQASDAYGGEPEPELEEPEALAQCTLVLAEAVHAGTRIRLECEQKGFSIVSHGTYDPRLIIPRLVSTLLALAPGAQRRLSAPESAFRTLPAEALGDEQHPYWVGADAGRLVSELMLALNAAAPTGFMFVAEGDWHNLGFFRQ